MSSWSYIDRIYDCLLEKQVKRWTLLLPGAGCSWYKASGGCSMCGFNRSTYRWTFGGKLLPVFVFKIFYTLGYLAARKEKPEVLTIYNGGSFINDWEIPKQFQSWVCQQVAKTSSVRKLFVESRAEFVTSEKIKELKNKLGGKILEVGIGLECATDRIRERCVHKGLLRSTYKRAIEILKEETTKSLTYVFLKPIYLTEKEAIDEAVKSIKYAFKVGSDAVALECAFIQEGTVMSELYHQGKYRPPWLWSIIEVVEQTYHLGPVYVGGFSDEPPPVDIPHNCESCSAPVKEFLEEFRKTQNIKLIETLDNNFFCHCKQNWEREVSLQVFKRA